MIESLSPKKDLEDLKADLREVQELLRRHGLAESPHGGDAATEREPGGTGEDLAGLRRKLDSMHPADIAYVLESLPLEERLVVWNLVRTERDGEILLEASDAVRETLIRSMDAQELVAAAEQLETDEIADLAPDLPEEVIHDVFQALPIEEREQLRAAMSYPEDSVGALMDFEVVSVREDTRIDAVTRYLRRFDRLPDHTDQIFVVDRDERLKGCLPLSKLIVSELEHAVAGVMADELVTLRPDDKAQEAAKAFERYDLVSAPVIDEQGRLVGRVTVDSVVDFIRSRSESELLSQAGLREEEDVFSSVWASVKNRWSWLAINLVTALIASRVIGIFEHSIEKLVALAALMPIVAGIGGNSGNQTITLIVRSMALGQVQREHAHKLLAKELWVSLLNGLIWGSALGLVTYWLYEKLSLAVVMMGAMTLNLVLAATAGVLIPLTLVRLRRDPALGSSVMITAITDSGGFFIFLGLATVFLI